MMSTNSITIQVEGVGKCYHIYDRPQDRLKQSILPRIDNLLNRTERCYYREFWALENVSFEVTRGETVGIIGRNGSGKSTLLQLICGTLEPTVGEIKTHGRIAALLELGAGFNPEFTGRENVYLNAAVLGLEQKEVDERFDRIAAFADIGDFIEQPVKHYSSGMYARLAFAVAINVDPDILIVDEALAVGDEPFQRKCFARIEEIKRNGGTILFVSHSSSAVVALCDRAILLSGGRRLYTGLPKIAVSWYQKLVNAPEKHNIISNEISNLEACEDGAPRSEVSGDFGDMPDQPAYTGIPLDTQLASTRSLYEPSFDPNLISRSKVVYECNGAEILDPRIHTLDGRVVNDLVKGQRYRIFFDVKFDVDAGNIRFYSLIKTVHGVELGGGTFPSICSSGVFAERGREFQVWFEFDCNLRPDTYFLNCGVGSDGFLLHRIIDALAFRVSSEEDNFANGCVDFRCDAGIWIK